LPPSREELRARSLSCFRSGRNWSKADIFLWDGPGPRLAIKDYAARPAWIRMTLGRCLVGRECTAYGRLQGIPGIPPFAGRIDSFAFAVGFIRGEDLSRIRRGDLPSKFFSRLLSLLDSIHRAGVAQGDLHHRDVICDPAGSPFLIDFSTAVFLEADSGRIRRHLFEAACASDVRAALKLKRRHDPGEITPGEREILDHPPRLYRAGKLLRRLVRAEGRGSSRSVER